MKLFEYEAKVIAQKSGIPIPKGAIITTPEGASRVFNEIGGPAVLKSQVLIVGRKKAGGIKFVSTAHEARLAADELLGRDIKGESVKQLLLEERVPIKKELYVGVTVDRSARCYTVLVSAEGGVDIEEVATMSPEKIIRKEVKPLRGFREYEGREIARVLGYSGKQLINLGSIITKIFQVATNYDSELTESNPLLETESGMFIAADFRMILDDNALFRHHEYQERIGEPDRGVTELEAKAREKGLSYVELEGDIGIIGNGAGLVMATLDMVQYYGGRPANFCDMGGGADADRIAAALEIVMSNPHVKTLFLNVFGGITRCNEVARAVIEIRNKGRIRIPIVIRMVGTNEEEGKSLLAKAGIAALDSMEDAAKEAAAAVKR